MNQYAHLTVALILHQERLDRAAQRRNRPPRNRSRAIRIVIGGRAREGERLVIAIARGS